MKLFSKPVRATVALLCAFSTVAPFLDASADTIRQMMIKDNGKNMSSDNMVNSVSGPSDSPDVSIIDFHSNIFENLIDGFSQLFTGQDLGATAINSVTLMQMNRSVGVVKWDRLNVDSGTTMWIQNAQNTPATLYNIVIGGTPTSIGGRVATTLPSKLSEAWSSIHTGFIESGWDGKNGDVNVWFINPAGVSVSSSATIDLNGYLGLVSGSVFDPGTSNARFNTDNAPGSITIESGALLKPAGGIYLIGNNISAESLIEANTFAANGNDVMASFNGLSIGTLTSSQSTIDTMTLSGVFRKELGVSAARNLVLGDLSVSSLADIRAENGQINIQGDLRFYDLSGTSKISAQGDINLLGGSVANNSKLIVSSDKGNILLDSSDNDFKGGLEINALNGTAKIGGMELSDHEFIVNTLGDISLHEYAGDLNLPNDPSFRISMSDVNNAKLSLETDSGSINIDNVSGWNGRLGEVTAAGGSLTVDTSRDIVLLDNVKAKSVSLNGGSIAMTTGEGTLIATTGDLTLKAKTGIEVGGGWQLQASKGTATFANSDMGAIVIGQSYLKADDQRVGVTAKRVVIEQNAADDLVIEESATVRATGKTDDLGGIRLVHKGDLYVFGGLTVDQPDPDKGFDPDSGQPLGYLLPEIVSTGTGRVKAMSLNMRNRDYSLSEVKDAVDAFGTWDNLEYVRLYNLGENFIVDKNMRLVTAAAGTRTGNRASTVFEGTGNLTVTLDSTELHAEDTGLRLAAGGSGTLTLNGADGVIETGSKSLNLSAQQLKTDGLVTIKAGTLQLSDGISADLSDNNNIYVDKLAGSAGVVSLKANAYLDKNDFRLAGDYRGSSLRLDTGRTASTRRNFIGGDAAYGTTDENDLYKLNVSTLEVALKKDAKLYINSDRSVSIYGIQESPGAEALTTVSDLRYSTSAGIHLDGNYTKGTLTVTALSDKKATGDIYLRETEGSMDVTTPIATKGAATFIASNDGATLKFAGSPNDIGGEIRIAGSETADFDFANYGAIKLRRLSGNDVTLTSVNNDITISSDAAYVKGLLTLSAEKGDVTVGTQSADTSLWSGRLGSVTAQGTVTVATGKKLTLEGDINAGEAYLSGVKGIEANGNRIVLTDENKVPHDEYVHRTSGRLTVKASKGSVNLADEGVVHHVKEFAGSARDSIAFRNDQDLTVGAVSSGDAVSIATSGNISVEDAISAYDVTLRASERIDFVEDGYISATHGTKFIVDFADVTLDLQAIQSRDLRESWRLGKISVQAGAEDMRYDVTVIGNDSAGFSVGEIVGDKVTLVSKKGLYGDTETSLRSLSGVDLQAAAGDIEIIGARAFEGTVTAAAPQGNIWIRTAGTLTVGDMAAKEENGLIDLAGTSIFSDGFAKRTLAADTLNLRATEDLVLDLTGNVNLNRVTAKNARLTALDQGASLTVADGSIDNLTAQTANDLTVVNDRTLGVGGLIVGGTANVSARGSIKQDGSLDEAGRVDIAGAATFKAKGDIYLDNPYNVFGSSISATANGAAVFSRATGGFVFDELTAKNAEIYAGTEAGSDIVVKDGSVQSLIAEAGGSLTFNNIGNLTLRAIDVDSLDVTASGNIVGSEKIVANSDTAQNTLTAGGKVELTHAENKFGSQLAVTAPDGVTLVNSAALALDVDTLAMVHVRNTGNLDVTAANRLRVGKISAEGGDITIVSPHGVYGTVASSIVAKDHSLTIDGGDADIALLGENEVQKLTATADGSLTFKNAASLELGSVAVRKFTLAANGDVTGADRILTSATLANPNKIEATGKVELSNASNRFGESLDVKAGSTVAVANTGDLELDVNAADKVSVANVGALDVMSDALLQLGTVTADSLRIRSANGVQGDDSSQLTVRGKTDVYAAAGNVELLGTANTMRGTVSAEAAAGNVAIVNASALTVGDLTAGGAASTIELTAPSVASDGKVVFSAGAINILTPGDTGRIDLDFYGNAALNRVVANSATFSSLGSLNVANGSVNTLSATTYNNLTFDNDKEIVLSGIDVGGDASITTTDGSISQRLGQNFAVQGTSTFKAAEDIMLDGVKNSFGRAISATAGRNATFNAPDGLKFSELTAQSATLTSSEGDISVAGGDVETLAATAAGVLTVANGKGLTLEGIDVQSMDLTVAGDVLSTEQVLTRATEAHPNRIMADGSVSLLNGRNQFGEALEVTADSNVMLVNFGDLDLILGTKTADSTMLSIINDGNLNVTAAQQLNIDVLSAKNVKVSSAKGIAGEDASSFVAKGTTDLVASDGDIKLVGENVFADTVTASAPKGNVTISTAGDLKVGDMTASKTDGKINLASTMITGDGKVRLSASEVNLDATTDGRIELDFLGATDLNRVVSDVAILSSDGAITVADGTVATLTATTGDSFKFKNSGDLVLAGIDVGAAAEFDVAGKLTQRTGDQVLVQATSNFKATDDIILDGNFNKFGQEITAETPGTARFNAPSGLTFASLTAKDANLTSSEGAIEVAAGHGIETLAAKAGGNLTVVNDRNLELKGIEAKVMALDVNGSVIGHEKIVTQATEDNPNVIVAKDVITLDNEKNVLNVVKVDTEDGKAVSLTDDGALTVTTRKALEVGSIVAESLTIAALNGIHGDSSSKVVSDDRLDLTATYNDIYLDGVGNAFQTLAARAPNGSVYVRNSKSTKIEEVVANEDGETTIITEGTLTSDGKLRLSGKANFTAEDIKIDFAGSADLGVVEANTVRLTALDEGSSITIENGKMNQLAAQTDRDLIVKNNVDLKVGDIDVGRNASFDIAGNLTQLDDTLVTVAGTSKFKTTSDLVLNAAGNHFGGTIAADVGGNATVNAADGLAFASLAAGNVALDTAAGDIAVANGAVRGTLTASAAAGNVAVDNGDNNLKVGDITASADGQIALKAKNLESDGQVKLAGGAVDLTADEAIDMDFKGSANLNRVVAQSAELEAADAGASITIADGSLDNLTARTAGSLTVANDKSLTMGATSVGGSANLNVAGTLGQSDALAVAGSANLKANDIVLDNPNNSFGTIAAEAANKATVAGADGLAFTSLKAKDADLRGGSGDIVVANGQVNALAAEADGNLAFINDRDLQLKAIDVEAIQLAVNGDLTGNGPVKTQSTAANPNTIVAKGAVKLGNEANDFGDVLNLTAGGSTTLANTGDLALNLGNDGAFNVLNNGTLSVAAGNVSSGRFETRGGDLSISANTLGSSRDYVQVASDKAIDVMTKGDASIARTDGGWTLGPKGGYLNVGGDLDLMVNGVLATEGDGVLSAQGNISVTAAGYSPMVAMYLGGDTLDVDVLPNSHRPQWTMFRTVGGNAYPRFVVHDGVWVVIDGRVTPTHPDYSYITELDQAHMTAMPPLTPTASVFGTRYFASENELGSIDLVGLGRYPYITYDSDPIEYTTKE